MNASPEHIALLRALKGSPLTILVALAVDGGHATHARLRALTSYTNKTITNAVHELATLELAHRVGDTISLTKRSAVLFTLEQTRTESLPPPPRSSVVSSGSSERPRLESQTPTTTTKAEGEISPCSPSPQTDLQDPPVRPAADPASRPPDLPPPWKGPVHRFVQLAGPPYSLALKTALSLITRGWDPLDMDLEVIRWADYCASDKGRTILAPGAFIAHRLQDGICCPAIHELSDSAQNRLHLLELRSEASQDGDDNRSQDLEELSF